MKSFTVEFQRFGDPAGIIRLSDRYIRTVGLNGPACEVGFGFTQEVLERGMGTLDYDNFTRPGGTANAVQKTADWFVKDMQRPLERFLVGDQEPIQDREATLQVEIVARPQELAQLPFEFLEEFHPGLIITRRIRQSWPLPPVNRSNRPKVLFAWAEPLKPSSTRRRMDVPHERHLDLLRELLSDWGDNAVVEVKNASRKAIKKALAENDSFTHVHLLAHGLRDPGVQTAPGERIALQNEAIPENCLALEADDGTLDRCPPDEFGALFGNGKLPETFAVATCHGAEIDSTRSGATLAHALHDRGVPIVVASQLALTKAGSDALIDTFLARVIDGGDPRSALRACRDKLRGSKDKTYFDRVALVGYMHIDADAPERLKQRNFEVALTRLKVATREAESGLEKLASSLDDKRTLSTESRTEAEKIRKRFSTVRKRLEKRADDSSLTNEQLEELRGLQASALKREAEAAFQLGSALAPDAGKEWFEHSRQQLADAATAYHAAASLSRDHHWTWVQWLALRAVIHGNLNGHEDDWVVAKSAALDTTHRMDPKKPVAKQEKEVEKAIWAWGSLAELYLLAGLLGNDQIDDAKQCLESIVKHSRAVGDLYPIESTLAQLNRYQYWWGQGAYPIPDHIVAGAKALHAHLQQLSSSKS